MPRCLSIFHGSLKAVLAGAIFLFGGVAAIAAEKPYTKDSQLFIYFGDKPVGSIVFEFETVDDALIVNSRVTIEEKNGETVLYSRREERRETWRNGKIESITNEVEEGGRSYTVSALIVGGQLAVSGPSGTVFAPKGAVPSTFWHIPDNTHGNVVDVFTGEAGYGDTIELPPVPMRLNGEYIEARHFLMTGLLNRSLYYGPENRWLGMRHLGPDGRMVEVRPE